MVRALLLALAGTNTESLWTEVKDAVAAGKHVDVGAHCQQKRGAGARLLSALAPTLNREREDIERVFAERMVVEEAALDRFGTLILVIAAVAPLLGLLGTVTGMISTFDVITEFGTGNPKLLSGGISEALVTTELGFVRRDSRVAFRQHSQRVGEPNERQLGVRCTAHDQHGAPRDKYNRGTRRRDLSACGSPTQRNTVIEIWTPIRSGQNYSNTFGKAASSWAHFSRAHARFGTGSVSAC